MNIHVLCVNCQSFRKTKYSSVFSEDTNISYSKCGGGVFVLEKALKKAAEGWRHTDYIILDHALGRNSEKSFRKLFAGIIYRYEKTIQEDPRVTAKKLKKTKKNNAEADTESTQTEESIIRYNRKKTHIFAVEIQGLTGYAFTYADNKILVLPKGLKADLIPEFIEKAQELYEENIESYPEGYSLTEKTYKILSFREKNFPVKGDSLGEILRKVIQLSAAAAFLVAGILLIYNMVYLPIENDRITAEIRTEFYVTETDPDTGETIVKERNWKKLKKINKEIIGWVKLNHTKIDYPVLEHKGDNGKSQYYLYRNYKGESSGHGSIFMDYRSKKGLKSKNAILHGHHMDDGSMFSDLMKYGTFTGNLSFYKKTPTIEISTEKGGTETYKIFSVFKSNVNPEQGEYFDFYCSDFESDSQFMNYVYNLQIRSLITTPITVNEDDKLLTLVTCSYEFDDFRTVIVARKCRKDENTQVDVGKASIPPTSLWPQVYYSTYGRTRPAVSTFKAEYEKGNVKWYDGDAKLDGNEELPTSTQFTEPATKKIKKARHTVWIYNRDKLIKMKQVKHGKSIKLPNIKKTYTEGDYKYTFTGWKYKGSKSASKITVDTIITANYKKTKINEKATKATKATKARKPTKATNATEAVTEKPTEAIAPTQAVTEPSEAETEAAE